MLFTSIYDYCFMFLYFFQIYEQIVLETVAVETQEHKNVPIPKAVVASPRTYVFPFEPVS